MSASSSRRARLAACVCGRKPSKKKRSVGRPQIVKAARIAEGPGAPVTLMPCASAALTELETGVRDERRAGIADERNLGALLKPRQQGRAHALGIVLVIGLERGRDAVAVEQAMRDARVLGQHDIRLRQGRERPQRHVAEIADGRRDDMQARRQGLALEQQQRGPCSDASFSSSSGAVLTRAGILPLLRQGKRRLWHAKHRFSEIRPRYGRALSATWKSAASDTNRPWNC